MREILSQEIGNVSGGALSNSSPSIPSNATTMGLQIGSLIGGFMDSGYTKLTGHQAFNEAAALGTLGAGIGFFIDSIHSHNLSNIGTAISTINQGIKETISGIYQGFHSLF